MRFLNFLLIICLFSISTFSQTNTFPASGNVGIGTINPAYPLHVLVNNNTNGIILANDTGAKFFMKVNQAGHGEIHVRKNGTDETQIYLNGGYKSWILQDFGIGINTPSHKLHVDGNIGLTQNKFIVGTRNDGSSHTIFGLDANNDLIFNVSAITAAKSSSTIIGVSGLNEYIDFRKDGQVSLLRILEDGKVGIGTTSPDTELTVNGTIHSTKVKVDVTVPAPDYVFEEGYDLTPLPEIKKFIQKEKHLPNIPSAEEMKANGLDLMEINLKLLEKVEELTLYTISQEERIEALEEKLSKKTM